MYLTENLQTKWAAILEHDSVSPIKDPYRKAVTAIILENQEKAIFEERGYGYQDNLNEAAPANATGAGIQNYDPILISLVRRALPNLIAYDICGVQPMTGPVGLIFAMKSRHVTQSGTEALFNEANTNFSSQSSGGGLTGTANGSVSNTNPVFALTDSLSYGRGIGMTTAQAEALGDGTAGNEFAEMAFSIDKVTVTARSRALKAEYTMEVAQDLKAIHGLEAEAELSSILANEILAEINREVVRSIYRSASLGAAYGTTTAGTYDLDTDSSGRWSVEKFKGLVFQIEREANAIAKATRRGRGNILIVSSDIASVLVMAKVLDYTPALNVDLQVDDTGNTFAGTIHSRMKVYIDPFFGGSSNGDELAVVGYKGASAYDAGLFYCPYVPLQMVRATGPNSFQNKVGFKTRYGLVANPFATVAGDGVVGDRNYAPQANIYYRIFRVRNIS